jgi:hypothetical protein
MRSVWISLVGAAVACLIVVGQAQQPPVQVPNPGVPQIMTLEATFVRVAYNNEGYVILGYQIANRTVGQDWIMLDVGLTAMEKTPDFTLKREAISLDTPDGKLPLPSIAEYRENEGKVQPLQNRMKVQRDSINYFPPSASRPCRIGFFSDLDSPPMAYDEVTLSSQRACLGRLYFHVPGGIKYGQHWLNVKFEKSLVRVPFRILTEEEEKLLSKNYKDISKQVEEAFKNPK